jgi:hypothetical protein
MRRVRSPQPSIAQGRRDARTRDSAPARHLTNVAKPNRQSVIIGWDRTLPQPSDDCPNFTYWRGSVQGFLGRILQVAFAPSEALL